VIIWSRWGILVFPFFGIGAGLGFLLKTLLGNSADSGSPVAMFVGAGLLLSAVGLWFFSTYVVERHLDKPQQAFFLQPLPVPVVHPNGVRQTHTQLPVLHPETGQPIWTQRRSTFFFVPVRYWPYILGALGLLLFVIGVVGTLAGLR
jgi:hypothetical protein